MLSGIYLNGYSLVCKLINELGIDLVLNFDNCLFIDVFLELIKLYVKFVFILKKEVFIKVMNYIIGGGFYENILCVLLVGYVVRIDIILFLMLKIFDWL